MTSFQNAGAPELDAKPAGEKRGPYEDATGYLARNNVADWSLRSCGDGTATGWGKYTSATASSVIKNELSRNGADGPDEWHRFDEPGCAGRADGGAAGQVTQLRAAEAS